MAKAFNLPIDYVLYDMTYANMLLYSASLPSYKKPKDQNGTGKSDDRIINGDDPEMQAEINKLFDES
ncbi:MAG: hypothetical protein HDS44_00050 [Bacteroides sp.]|nr:hypothetical protein [Bacteroides sp.]